MSDRKRSKIYERVFVSMCVIAIALPLVLLVALILNIAIDAMGRIGWDFLVSYPSRKPQAAGVLPGLVGSMYLMLITAGISLPIGVAAAVYLEEYALSNWFSRFIEVNIANLAGVPSVIYGLLGLELFVRAMGMGRSLLAGGCTMALLVLPIVILSSREALRTVPSEVRQGALALGASRWQVVRRVVLPMAMPGILTGSILSISRAIGETAPLIVVGALTYITFLPDGVMSPFTVLPIQIFNWVSRPQQAFVLNAAAGIVVLLVTLVLLNATAIIMRNRLQKRRNW